MGFPTTLTAPQKVTCRTSGYWQRTFVAFNPGEIVFQCEADEDLTDTPFKTFQWTNTLAGAYTDVWAGLVVYISSGSNYLKDYKYRGRVRLAPSATEFYIDLNATTLLTGDIITVLRDADINARIREGALVDGSIAFHSLPPVTTGMPSVLVLVDTDGDGSVDYTPAQTGIAVESGETIASYAWAISGAGTSSISNAAIQNPLLTFDAGFHYLVRLTTTDSNGVANYLITQVYAVTQDFAAPVILQAVAGNVSQDLDNGYTGSITAYTGVSTLPYRTHAAVFCVEHFGDDSDTPINTNVLMHGRLRSENIVTEGSAEAGRLMRVTYPIEGITSYMQRLKVPNDIVRQIAAPNEWGEIVDPTPFRMAVYFLYAYTTLLNLCSFSAGNTLFDDWRVGGLPVSIDGGYALDTLNTILDRIKAAPNYAPDGEIRCEINASYQQDRSGLITIMDFLPEDTRSFELDIDTSKSIAQVVGFGGVWNSTNNRFTLFTAQSPSITYSDAPEVREVNRELLKHNSTTTAAKTEIAARTGNDYAFNNPKWLIPGSMRGAHRWLVATNYQRYTWTIAAVENTRGVVVTSDTFWQCQSVNITINTDGTFGVNPQFVEETEFTDAQNIASLLPDNLQNMNPVLPVLSDDLAYPDDPLWAYPDDNPTDDELQPIDPFSLLMGNAPLSPDQAAAAANKAGTPKCKKFQVLARNSGMTNSPFLTTNSAPYTLKISGSAILSSGYLHSSNFVASEDGWEPYPGGGGADAGTYNPGQGWGASTGASVGRGHFVYLFGAPAFITSVSITHDPILTGDVAELAVGQWDGAAITDSTNQVQTALTMVFPVNDTWAGIAIQQSMSANPVTPALNGFATNVTVRGTGTNPFTGEPADDITGDWFYQIQGDMAQLWEPTEGGLIDGNKPAILPEYSPNHTYEIPFTGTGNAIQAAYALASYVGVQNRAFTIEVCRD